MQSDKVNERDSAFKEFLEREYSVILKTSKRFTTNYEELASDVIIKLHTTKVLTIPQEKIPAYIYFVVRSVFFEGKKSRWRKHIEVNFDDDNIDERYRELVESGTNEDRKFFNVYLKHKGNIENISKELGTHPQKTYRRFREIKERLRK